MTVAVFEYLILISIDFLILCLRFLLRLVTIEKIYFLDHTPNKHLEVRQNYSAPRRIAFLFSVFGNVVKQDRTYLSSIPLPVSPTVPTHSPYLASYLSYLTVCVSCRLFVCLSV